MTSTILKATTQKSYYRKAHILTDDNGNKFLQSYDTIVCGFVSGNFERYWNGYSVTTMNHINDFLKLLKLSIMNKKTWTSLTVKKTPISKSEHVSANMGNQYYGMRIL